MDYNLATMEGYHESVLLREAIDALNIRDAWYLDCTLGDGGHSIEIIRRGGKVVGLDVDPQALARVQKRFKDEEIKEGKFKLILGNFRDIKNLIKTETKFEGVLFDLGVSSLQLETPERGFSFGKEGPLDMRMDPQLSVTAADLVNGLNSGELFELFTKLGEEKFAKKIAEEIINFRSKKPITSTLELAHIAEKVKGKFSKIHPATKIFQALRIAINDERNCLKEALPQALELLDNKGIIIVISFHSLEDRIVKHFFKSKNLIIPSTPEININPRSRSAKMRVYKKYD